MSICVEQVGIEPAENPWFSELRQLGQVAENVGGFMLRGFQSPSLKIWRKVDNSVVTELDEAITDHLASFYVSRGERFVSEERGSTTEYGDEDAYYVDPVDGTANLVKGRKLGRSLAMFSLARVAAGQPVTAVTHAPLLRRPRTYLAAQGQGAHRFSDEGAVTLHNDPTISPENGIILVSEKRDSSADWLEDQGFTLLALNGAVFKACCVADPDLLREYCDPAFLPGGKEVAGFVSQNTYPHDTLAAGLIGREAGLIVTNSTGGEKLPLSPDEKKGSIFARSEAIHALLLESLRIAA